MCSQAPVLRSLVAPGGGLAALMAGSSDAGAPLEDAGGGAMRARERGSSAAGGFFRAARLSRLLARRTMPHAEVKASGAVVVIVNGLPVDASCSRGGDAGQWRAASRSTEVDAERAGRCFGAVLSQSKATKTSRVSVSADRDVAWQEVVRTLDAVHAAGLEPQLARAL